MDGSITSEGSGLRVVLVSSHREEAKLAIRLYFKVSNNEVEYKA